MKTAEEWRGLFAAALTSVNLSRRAAEISRLQEKAEAEGWYFFFEKLPDGLNRFWAEHDALGSFEIILAEWSAQNS